MTSRAGRKSAAKVVREQIAREQRRKRALWTSVIAIAALVIAGLIGWGVYASQGSGDVVPPPAATGDSGGIKVGSGPVTIDVYEDFICPACRQFEQTTGATLDRLVADGRATVVYHPIAFLDRASSTQYSTRSAAAAACADAGGKFREYAKALFQRQPSEGGPGLSDGELIAIGTSVGLPEAEFRDCVQSGRYRPWVGAVTEAASENGVTGTPTVLVNGQQIQQPTPQAITAAVDAAA
jgi:protein-disulfide isomerase